MSAAPTSKIAAAGGAGAAAVVLVWLLGLFNIEMDATTAAALAVLIGTVAGYIKTERRPASGGRHAKRTD